MLLAFDEVKSEVTRTVIRALDNGLLDFARWLIENYTEHVEEKCLAHLITYISSRYPAFCWNPVPIYLMIERLASIYDVTNMKDHRDRPIMRLLDETPSSHFIDLIRIKLTKE
jgi:hypothetical protein